ncbi:MAG: exported protein of unknown function [Candidatus Saccharibacteria bacterium]|nr:exported protein of unknown function [Candidatus Saccharibacteria bacterium]
MRRHSLSSWRHTVLLGILLLTSLTFPLQVLATTAATSSKGLTFSPLRTELGIAPGTSHETLLRVTNSTDKPMVVRLSAEAFRVINQQYDYAFSSESDLAKWVWFASEEVSLAPGERKNVTATIGVPLTTEPGGRYISLFASTDTGTENDGINSRQRVASLIYLTVLGDVSRVGRVVSLAAPWFVSGQSQWSMAIRNSGTTHFQSRYEVRIQHLFGDGIVAKTSGDALILPGTVRAVSDTLPVLAWPGLYKVVYTIGLGDTPTKAETRFVLYMPPAALAVIAIIVLAVGLLLLRRRRKH